MNTSVVMTRDELNAFLMEATLALGDPAQTVCQLFVPWDLEGRAVQTMFAMWDGDDQELQLLIVEDYGIRTLPLAVSAEDVVIEDGRLKAFHVRKVSRGTWALAPSLNIPGELHAFVVLTGVPDPAPWERLVILATSF